MSTPHFSDRYDQFDKFGLAPSSFAIQEIDEGLVELVIVSSGGVRGFRPALTTLGRTLYEKRFGGPPKDGWAKSPDIVSI